MKNLISYLFAVSSITALTSCDRNQPLKKLQDGYRRHHWYEVMDKAECAMERGFKHRVISAFDDNGTLVTVSSKDTIDAVTGDHDETLKLELSDGRTLADMTYNYHKTSNDSAHATETGVKETVTLTSEIHLHQFGRQEEATLIEQETETTYTDNKKKTTITCRFY